MNIILKYETVVATNLPILTLNLRNGAFLVATIKKRQNLEVGQLIFCYATNLHCDILISLSSRKK